MLLKRLKKINLITSVRFVDIQFLCESVQCVSLSRGSVVKPNLVVLVTVSPAVPGLLGFVGSSCSL